MVGPVFSEMAGPNYVKLSGIDEGHSEHVFGQKNNCVIIVINCSLFAFNPNKRCFPLRLVAAAKQVSTSHIECATPRIEVA